MRHCRRTLFAVALLIPTAPPAWGQPGLISGYLQTVGLISISGGFSESDPALYSRLRVAAEPEFGTLAFALAYEITATIPQPGDSYGTVARVSGVGADSNDWLDLHGVLTEGKQFNAQHRIDRLQFNWSRSGTVEFNLGRQAISWGTTLFLTPADPFIPFHPVDPFREFRSGTDAIRLQVYPSPLSECDLVIRPSRLDGEEEFTALVRGLTTWYNWEVSAWGGVLYDEFAGAVAAAGDIGTWALRLEAVLRKIDGTLAGRGTIGFDRSLQVDNRDLRIVLEYQRDGHGAIRQDDMERILESRAYRRGDFQALGRDQFAMQASYQIDPLWNISALVLWNLNNSSGIFAPGFSYSLSNEATITGGMYLGAGESIPMESRSPDSEDSPPDLIGFLSVSWYF